MDLRNLEFPSFYCIYSRLPRNGVGGVHVFHECLPTSSTKTYPKVTTFRKGRRDGHPVAPTLSAQKAPFEDCVLGGRGLPIPLYSGLGNPSSSLNLSFLRDSEAAVTATTPLSPLRLLARSLGPTCVSRRGVIAVRLLL